MTTTETPPDPGYRTKLETIHGAGADLQVRSLLDRQQFHDPLGAAEALGISSATWPLFGLLWPTGRVLAHAMVSFEIKGRRILELGCGLALASLVIHRRGGDITASDCHPLTEGFLRENLRLNHLPRLKYQTGHWNRENPALGRFDLIIASDVLYERNQPEVLATFIDLHANERANIIVLDPDRGNRNAFCRSMVARGYESDVQRAGVAQCTGEAYKGHFLNFSR